MGLALYNIAFVAPLLVAPLAVSDRRVLGTIGRWNRANRALVKTVLALGVGIRRVPPILRHARGGVIQTPGRPSWRGRGRRDVAGGLWSPAPVCAPRRHLRLP